MKGNIKAARFIMSRTTALKIIVSNLEIFSILEFQLKKQVVVSKGSGTLMTRLYKETMKSWDTYK